MVITPKTLKGFRDFLPKEARKRQYVANSLKKAFESYGYEPLETPTLEYEEILSGKYGEEGDKLMYKFEDNGKRRVAMRYDQTVPLARVVAQYKNDIPLPFKRYQISNVFRGDNTQRGRFREFTQCDIDTVGPASILADAQTIACVADGLKLLGFENYKILINNRSVFEEFTNNPIIIRSIDKIKKVGQDKVIDEMVNSGIKNDKAREIINTLTNQKPTSELETLFDHLKKCGVNGENFEFDPFLARGLDYYTGTIFEVEIEGYDAGSVAGGGRYDNLIGMFSGEPLPAVGCAFGFDRLIDAMEENNLFPDLTKVSTTRILVTIFSQDLTDESIKLANYIRENGLNCELYDNPNDKLEKQIKYADKKGIMYAAIIGPEEIKNNTVTIKNLRVSDQQTVAREDLLKVT